jgi:hypothetical protein
LVPFGLISVSYFFFDPFKVLYDYDDYYEDYFIEPNRDFVSVEKYLKYKDTINYKSFIFGSSRLMAWRTDSWEKYIGDTNAYHFDAYKDNLFGIWCKIKLIDRVGEKLDNVLLVIEYDLLNEVNDTSDRLFMKHHIYTEKSKFQFHNFFFQQYLNSNFYLEYLDYRIFRKFKKYMKQIDLNEKNSSKYSNDFYIHNLDRSLKQNPEKYYSQRDFYKRDSIQLFYQQCIYDKQIEYLTEIKSIFDKHKSKYKIVISPLFDQKKMLDIDNQKLNEIFEKENIYDFSGINEFTEKIENYYDIYHYRPHVADFILDSIY